jgi:hypothetical protein
LLVSCDGSLASIEIISAITLAVLLSFVLQCSAQRVSGKICFFLRVLVIEFVIQHEVFGEVGEQTGTIVISCRGPCGNANLSSISVREEWRMISRYCSLDVTRD